MKAWRFLGVELDRCGVFTFKPRPCTLNCSCHVTKAKCLPLGFCVIWLFAPNWRSVGFVPVYIEQFNAVHTHCHLIVSTLFPPINSPPLFVRRWLCQWSLPLPIFAEFSNASPLLVIMQLPFTFAFGQRQKVLANYLDPSTSCLTNEQTIKHDTLFS